MENYVQFSIRVVASSKQNWRKSLIAKNGSILISRTKLYGTPSYMGFNSTIPYKQTRFFPQRDSKPKNDRLVPPRYNHSGVTLIFNVALKRATFLFIAQRKL